MLTPLRQEAQVHLKKKAVFILPCKEPLTKDHPSCNHFPLIIIAHYGLAQDLPLQAMPANGGGQAHQRAPLQAMSATGGQQARRHSWTRRILVCSTYVKNSTAELLTVKGIQLLFIFSGWFQPPDDLIYKS